jgi:predicted DsbA family dithiol-disulfide isomerase
MAIGVEREPGDNTAWRTPIRIHSSTNVAQNVAVIEGEEAIPSIVAPMRVEIFSDVVCPWCYIGKARFDRAIANLRDQGIELDVEVAYSPYQLDPTAPIGTATPVLEAYSKKFGGLEKAQAILDHVTAIAAQEGIVFNMDIALRANTLSSHRLLTHALAMYGPATQAVLKESIMRAYFTNGKDISTHDVLLECAIEAEMDIVEARRVLVDNLFATEVAEHISFASNNGITAVPTYVINDQWSVPGAQDTEMFERVLTRLAEKQ